LTASPRPPQNSTCELEICILAAAEFFLPKLLTGDSRWPRDPNPRRRRVLASTAKPPLRADLGLPETGATLPENWRAGTRTTNRTVRFASATETARGDVDRQRSTTLVARQRKRRDDTFQSPFGLATGRQPKQSNWRV